MCVAAAKGCNRDRNEKPEVCSIKSEARLGIESLRATRGAITYCSIQLKFYLSIDSLPHLIQSDR